ncbi:MAG: DUF2269 family protein [Actinomycetota bacterium]|nr:DUF2269 family protein [Actinomycetota bacterium]
MKYSGAYAILLALHLLTVAFLVGPAAVAAVLSPRHVRAGRLDALRDSARTTRLYTLLTLVTVVLGSAMIGVGDVGAQWSFAQAWISATYALWIVAVALVLAVVVPAQRRAAAEIEAGRDAGALAGRIAAAGGVAMLCWSAIIVLMVTKAGA